MTHVPFTTTLALSRRILDPDEPLLGAPGEIPDLDACDDASTCWTVLHGGLAASYGDGRTARITVPAPPVDGEGFCLAMRDGAEAVIEVQVADVLDGMERAEREAAARGWVAVAPSDAVAARATPG